MTTPLAKAIPDLEVLPGDALITRQQLSTLSSFALPTLKLWAKQGRGPRITTIEGRPRYRVRDVRSWMSGRSDCPVSVAAT